ncbi:MAG: SPOR domain-containing protein [Bacteroidales bacterium]|nr:SPOR domain-containing protein [Bacteroidales bacterium]
MKRSETLILIFVTFIALAFSTEASAQQYVQEIVIPEGYELVDSVIYRPAAAVDTSLVGKTIYQVLSAKEHGSNAEVVLHQTDSIYSAMSSHLKDNAARTLSGYRIRIFFDNKQTARVASEEALKKFESLFHDVSAYRSYANPYFKVTVGDFRTRSEAMSYLERIRKDFPSAFVVKENIAFPVIDKNNSFVTDTIKVLRPIL